MSKAGTVVVSDRGEEYLSFPFKSAEGIAVKDAVSVALKFGAVRALILRNIALSTGFVDTCAGIFTQYADFCYLDLFTNCHNIPPAKNYT
jgi:hypothetical protein